jgi:PAS domain S-box-containing protein
MDTKSNFENPSIETESFKMAMGNDNQVYRQIFEKISDGVVIFEPFEGESFRIVEVNHAFELATGFNRNQLAGKTLEDAIMGKTVKELSQNLSYCMEQLSMVEEEVSLDFPTGRRRFTLTFTPVYSDDNQACGIAVIIRDITDGRYVEEALQEKNRHMRALLRLSRNLECAQSYVEVLSAAFEEVKTIIGYQRLWVYLLTEDKKYADLLTLGGSEFEIDVSRLTIEGDRMLEELTSASSIMVVEDAQNDDRVDKKIVALLKNRTIVNVPIILFDRHLGMVGAGTFGDEGIRVPTSAEYEFLTALASHMAVSLDRIHSMIERNEAVEALRKTNAELEQHRQHLESLVAERTRELSRARDAAKSSN